MRFLMQQTYVCKSACKGTAFFSFYKIFLKKNKNSRSFLFLLAQIKNFSYLCTLFTFSKDYNNYNTNNFILLQQ